MRFLAPGVFLTLAIVIDFSHSYPAIEATLKSTEIMGEETPTTVMSTETSTSDPDVNSRIRFLDISKDKFNQDNFTEAIEDIFGSICNPAVTTTTEQPTTEESSPTIREAITALSEQPTSSQDPNLKLSTPTEEPTSSQDPNLKLPTPTEEPTSSQDPPQDPNPLARFRVRRESQQSDRNVTATIVGMYKNGTDLDVEYNVQCQGEALERNKVDEVVYDSIETLASALDLGIYVFPGPVKTPEKNELSVLAITGMTTEAFDKKEGSFKQAIADALNKQKPQTFALAVDLNQYYGTENVQIWERKITDGTLYVTYYVVLPGGRLLEEQDINSAVENSLTDIAAELNVPADKLAIKSPPEANDEGTGLESWAIALIVVGAALVLLVIIAVGLKMTKKKKDKDLSTMVQQNPYRHRNSYQAVSEKDEHKSHTYINKAFDHPIDQSDEVEERWSSQL